MRTVGEDARPLRAGDIITMDALALQFNDKLKARELMAIAGGERKQRADHKHTFDYAAFVGSEPPADDDE